MLGPPVQAGEQCLNDSNASGFLVHPPEFRCQEPMGPYLTCKERLRLTSAQVEKPADHTPGPNTINFQNTKPFESSALLL